MNDTEQILLDFIEWARDCGEDAFFIFEFPEKAVRLFLESNEVKNRVSGHNLMF